jgi:hypothetical protein
LRLSAAAAAVASMMSTSPARAVTADCLPNISGGTANPDPKAPPSTASGWMTYTLPNVVDEQGMPKSDVLFRVRSNVASNLIFASWLSTTPVTQDALINVGPGAATTSVWVGLGEKDSSKGTLIRLDIPQSSVIFPGTGATKSTALVINAENVTAGVTEPGMGQPTWAGAEAWINITDAGINNGVQQYTYSIQMKVPVGPTTIPLSSFNNLTAWSQILTGMPANTVVEYAYAGTRTQWAIAHSDFLDGTAAVPLEGWHTAFTSIANSPVQECFNSSGTISVDNRFMGVNSGGTPDGFDGTVNLFGGPADKTLQTLQQNDISAFVFNSTPNPLPIGDIQMRWTVAEWGSQSSGSWIWLTPGGELYDTASATKQFNPTIDATPLGPQQWANENQASLRSNTNQILPGGGEFIDVPWTPSIGYACQFMELDRTTLFASEYVNQCSKANVPNHDVVVPTAPSQALTHHQCIQIHVKSLGSHFNELVVQRNMEFGHASQFQEAAKIDTKGVPHINSFGHWVYLYVETYNMPEHFADGRGHQFSYPPNENPGIITAPIKPLSEEGDWRVGFPTYIVHVYHDTGRKFRGAAVLEPQTSFGYYVAHDGTDAFGFRHLLQPTPGGGALAWQPLAPNYYRVFIPNDGAVYVTTTVQSIENQSCQGNVSTDLGTLIQALLPFVSSSSDCTKDLLDLLHKVPVQCVDLNAVLQKVLSHNWGQFTQLVHDIVTELKLASGCSC